MHSPRTITPHPDHHVLVYTDHAPIIDALAAGCAHAYAYWRLQRFIASFPSSVAVRQIAGAMNPADSFTRDDLRDWQHDPAWQIVLGDARRFHEEQQKAVHDAEHGILGEHSREWADTARNPFRTLG